MGGGQEAYLPERSFVKLTFWRMTADWDDVLPCSDADLVRFVHCPTILGSLIPIRLGKAGRHEEREQTGTVYRSVLSPSRYLMRKQSKTSTPFEARLFWDRFFCRILVRIPLFPIPSISWYPTFQSNNSIVPHFTAVKKVFYHFGAVRDLPVLFLLMRGREFFHVPGQDNFDCIERSTFSRRSHRVSPGEIRTALN